MNPKPSERKVTWLLVCCLTAIGLMAGILSGENISDVEVIDGATRNRLQAILDGVSTNAVDPNALTNVTASGGATVSGSGKARNVDTGALSTTQNVNTVVGGATNTIAAGSLTGTIADARLSAAVVLTNGSQTISGAKTFTDTFRLESTAQATNVNSRFVSKSFSLTAPQEAYYDALVSWALYGGSSVDAQNYSKANAANYVIHRWRAAAGQTTNLVEWQDSSGNNLGWIGPDGKIVGNAGGLTNVLAGNLIGTAADAVYPNAVLRDGSRTMTGGLNIHFGGIGTMVSVSNGLARQAAYAVRNSAGGYLWGVDRWDTGQKDWFLYDLNASRQALGYNPTNAAHGATFQVFGSQIVDTNLTVLGTFNQIPLSFSLPINTINGNSNWMTFAHGIVPSGKTVTINYVQSLLDNGNAPGTDQVVRIYDATGASTLLATNGNWNGTVTITNGLRWYARMENNSTTNINVSASIHGNIK